MEIERKFLVNTTPDLSLYKYKDLTQAYVSREPVLRIRKDGENYEFTSKGKGLLEREEMNLPISKETFDKLLKVCDGPVITKRRYLIPLDKNHTCELDVFSGDFNGLIIAEVEFSSLLDAERFNPPSFFSKEVTMDNRYQNVNLHLLSSNDF